MLLGRFARLSAAYIIRYSNFRVLSNILIAIEFFRFRIVYLLVRKTITSGPATPNNTPWVYDRFLGLEKGLLLCLTYLFTLLPSAIVAPRA